MDRICYILFLSTINWIFETDATLSKSDKKQKTKSNAKNEPEDVHSNSNTHPLSARDILENHNKYVKDELDKKFEGTVLGYVTPWNSKGYDIAKSFGTKFNLISPVWLQVNVENGEYKIGGLHDVDQGWVSEVRSKGAKIVPRILFDRWTGQDFVSLFGKADLQKKLSKLLLKCIKDNKFDGLTIEVWSQLGGQARPQLAQLLGHLADDVRRLGFLFILVIPPALYQGNQQECFLLWSFKSWHPKWTSSA